MAQIPGSRDAAAGPIPHPLHPKTRNIGALWGPGYGLAKGSTSEFGMAVSKDEISNELARNSKLHRNSMQGTAFSLLDLGKRVAFEVAIKAERPRGAEASVVRV